MLALVCHIHAPVLSTSVAFGFCLSSCHPIALKLILHTYVFQVTLLSTKAAVGPGVVWVVIDKGTPLYLVWLNVIFISEQI